MSNTTIVTRAISPQEKLGADAGGPNLVCEFVDNLTQRILSRKDLLAKVLRGGRTAILHDHSYLGVEIIHIKDKGARKNDKTAPSYDGSSY